MPKRHDVWAKIERAGGVHPSEELGQSRQQPSSVKRLLRRRKITCSLSIVTRMKNSGLQIQQRWNTIKTMMSCMTAKPWNRLHLLWSLHYGKFLRLDKYLLCGVTGIADLAFEQGNSSGGLLKTLPGPAFYESAFRTIVSFASRVRFNTSTLEAVILQFHSAEVKWMRIRC